LKTITELHAEIDKRFAAAGIEIAFPQRDLHLRSADATLGVIDSNKISETPER
jgi:potassium efflux system protein